MGRASSEASASNRLLVSWTMTRDLAAAPANTLVQSFYSHRESCGREIVPFPRTKERFRFSNAALTSSSIFMLFRIGA
jgi:hypothetical protein